MEYDFNGKKFTLKKASYKLKSEVKKITGDNDGWVEDFEKAKQVLAYIVEEDVSEIKEDEVDSWEVLGVYYDFFMPRGEMLKKLQASNLPSMK